MTRVAPEILAARQRVALAKRAALDAYLLELARYVPQSRIMRERDSDATRQTGGAYDGARYAWRPAVTGHVTAPVQWRGVSMRSNTDARKWGGPGPMRMQGRRLGDSYTEPPKPAALAPLIDHVICSCCPTRIDLRKHDYYTTQAGETLCETCAV